MPSHVQLQKAHCIICQHCIAAGERAAAVLGDPATGNHKGSTFSFEFPAHGHDFKNTTVYINKGEETWRLCRYPPCSVCSDSLKAFVFHVDCFRLAKATLSTLPLSSIWHLGLFVSPSAGLHYPRRLCWNSAHLATDIYPAADLSSIIEGLRRLPNELCEMIQRECPESPLWRYSVVNSFSSHYLLCSQALIAGCVCRVGHLTARSSQTCSISFVFRAMFHELASNIQDREAQRSQRYLTTTSGRLVSQ